MKPSFRLLVIFAVAGCYLLIVYHLMSVQPECPSATTNNGVAGGPIVNDSPVSDPKENQGRDGHRDDGLKYLVKNPAEGHRALRNQEEPPGSAVTPKPKQGEGATPKQTTPAPYVYDVDRLPVDQLLSPDYAPHNVYMVWCGRRWFEFQHYLAIKSVIKELRPDNLFFYHDSMPIVDYWLYNTWFDEIRQEYPFIRLVPVSAKDNVCSEHGKTNVTFIYNLVARYGGLYINEHTILTHFPITFRNQSFVDAFDEVTNHGFLLAKRGVLNRFRTFKAMHKSNLGTHLRCSFISNISDYSRTLNSHCVTVMYTVFPKDIWELKNNFGRLARRLFYGNPEIPIVRKSDDELIPNIGHIVWIGGGEMDYLFYLCVLSLLYVAKVEVLYIHGDAPPSGMLWEKVKNEPKLHLIYRETPGTVYGTQVDVLSHVTDIWRVDFMIRYGGIYVDTDTIFAKPLDREIRSYEAVGSVDWTYWNHPFPDSINFGVAIGKRNAEYWHKFQESMKWFIDKDWSWNGLRQPYRIKERQPELMLINPYLQVICFEFKCRPTWYPNYHNESIHHLNSPSMTNWRKDVYAFHFTLPTPPELRSEYNLMTSNSMFSEVGKNVLKAAGRLPKPSETPPNKRN